MVNILIVAVMLVCALMAIRATRLLISAIWLAVASALVALSLYLLGAPEVAVIELSVGAGLVTVLFVFAINIAGEEPVALDKLIPRPLTWISLFVFLLLLGYFCVPAFSGSMPAAQITSLPGVLWENRSLDILLLAVLMFSGVLGVIGLLTDPKHHEKEHGQ